MTIVRTGSSARSNYSIIKGIGKPYAPAAYSFRQLGTDYVPAGYSGANIQVIRDFDHTTHEVKFSGGLRDDVDMVDFVTSHGTHPGATGFLQIWYDQSGNGLDAVQFSAGQQPIVVDAGVAVTQNGMPSAYYDGNMFLEASYTSNHFANICISAFVVYACIERTTVRTAFSIGSPDGDEHLGLGWHNVGFYNFYYPFGGISCIARQSATNNLVLFTGRILYSTAEYSLMSNLEMGGVPYAFNPPTIDILSLRNDILAGTIKIGATKIYGSNLYGYLSEAIVFNNNTQDLFINQTQLRERDIISTYGL